MQNLDDLKVTLVQSELHWEKPEANMDMFAKKLEAIRDTDFIFLPEMFTTGFTNNSENLAERMHGKTMQWMSALAASKNCPISGSVIIEEEGEYFNRLICMFPDGAFQYYDKRHLFALAGEDKYFSGGQEKLIIDHRGWKINFQICYDLRFPVWARRKSDQKHDYNVLVYVANWPIPRVQAWSTLLKARSIENMSYVIGVNRVGVDGNGIEYSGKSEVFDPLGNSLGSLPDSEDGIIDCVLKKPFLHKTREKFNFQNDADPFEFL